MRLREEFIRYFENLGYQLISYFENIGFTTKSAFMLKMLIFIFVIIILAFLADVLVRVIIIRIVKRIIKKSKNKFDDIFVKRKVFERLGHILPAIVVSSLIRFALEDPVYYLFVQSLCYVYMIIISIWVINTFLNAMHEIYLQFPIAKNMSIKGYIQIVKILIYVIGSILIISILLDKNPATIFAGLGALAAVFLLVFRDTILGFVASIQISTNQMVKPNDWITMPSKNVDGTVKDISLTTVKVENWDKSVSMLPTYSLVQESFINWRVMEESGTRRIKRSVNIDMESVKFCKKDLLNHLQKIRLLKNYINEELLKIKSQNNEKGIAESDELNALQLTNLGLFRKYIELFLIENPMVNTEMSMVVRQLQSNQHGIPIEIMVFCNDTRLQVIEDVQADIFDHIIAISAQFELKIKQA